MDDFPWAYCALPIAILVGYLAFYRLRVARHGAYGAAAAEGERDKWGLRDGEEVTRLHYVGETYVGPLSPSVDDAPGSIHLVLTTRGRLVLAKGYEQGSMRPFMAFEPHEMRPLILPGREVFAGHPKLPGGDVGPTRPTAEGAAAKLALAQLVTPAGDRYTFWCEPAGLADLRAWCVGLP
jgi:hypothetical protein